MKIGSLLPFFGRGGEDFVGEKKITLFYKSTITKRIMMPWLIILKWFLRIAIHQLSPRVC